jgi:hypothetical protein
MMILKKMKTFPLKKISGIIVLGGLLWAAVVAVAVAPKVKGVRLLSL